jgi:magnesium transporter
MAATDAALASQEWLRALHDAQDEADTRLIEELLRDVPLPEIARALETFPQGERLDLLHAASVSNPARLLLYLSRDAAAHLAEAMGAEVLSEAALDLDASELAELVDALDADLANTLLERSDIVRRREVESLLAYDEGTAARVMHRDVITVRGDTGVAVVHRYLQRQSTLPANTDQLMVVDRDGRFRGTLAVMDLFTADPGRLVSEVMDEQPVIVEPELAQQGIMRLFLDRDLMSAPVVDADGQLLGRIVASDVMDLVEDRAEHAMLARDGLDEDEDLFAPLLPSARKRAVWLGINLATAFLAAAVIGQFEATLEALVALAVLMPIVASMGGIAGSQTLSLAIRGLAQGQILPTNRGSLLGKEVGIGALNGVFWSFVVGGIAGAWYLNTGLGIVIGVALIINMVAAALSGIIVPLVLKRLGFDPAISGPVVLTTVTDVVGFLSFLGLATLFLI